MPLSRDRIQRLILACLLAGAVVLFAAPARGQAGSGGGLALAGGQAGSGEGQGTLGGGVGEKGGRPSEAEIGKVQVYLTPDQALREIFVQVTTVDTIRTVLEDAERETLHRQLGRAIPGDPLVILKPRDKKGLLLGYAVIAEEVGKYRPITFMVGTDAEFKVRNVEVLVYRESRGGDVRRARFLRQYRGKTDDDPIRTNRDILNIAGATLSVTALNHGIKRVLATLSLLAERNAL